MTSKLRLQAHHRLVYLRGMVRIFDINDRIRLRERFFGASRTVLARL
jgi:hypothetical protein